MTYMPEKREVLQVLLDTSKLATDLFDIVDEGGAVITREMVARVKQLAGRLNALDESMTIEYALSGRAGRDMLSEVQDQLREGQSR
jgi:hypothetical protein